MGQDNLDSIIEANTPEKEVATEEKTSKYRKKKLTSPPFGHSSHERNSMPAQIPVNQLESMNSTPGFDSVTINAATSHAKDE